MSAFEQKFFEYFDRTTRYIKSLPLNLGGIGGSGGGVGGPPGGYIGKLPQTRVTYDESEAETLATASGPSLLDNLNHMRYRISRMEASGIPGVTIYEDGIIVASGITILDFVDNFEVTSLDETATITLRPSGVRSDATYSGVSGEDLTSQVNGITDHFTIANEAHPGSIAVYYNGVRERDTTVTEDATYDGFTLGFVPASGDTLNVDYIVAFEGSFHTHHQYLTSGDTYTQAQLQTLLDLKADVVHTHVEADITDLVHDADYIIGIPISGPPLPGQVLAFDNTISAWATRAVTISQQFIFTVEGLIDTAEVKPLRIYSHSVGDGATISEVFCSLGTAPTGTAIRVDILKNGASIFSSPTYVEIPVGNNTASKTTFLTDTFTKDDYFQMEVETTDSAASDLTVHLRFNWEA